MPRCARRKPTISSESRWFSAFSACLPRPRAVDTNPPSCPNVRQALLHHHRDRLSERRAAYRPRLRGDRHRRHRPLHAARRPRRLSSSPAPTSTASRCCRRRRKEKLTPRELVERNVPRFQAMVKKFNCSNDDFIRTTEPRHYRVVGGDLGAHAGGRRHLSRQIFRLVLGARRGLLRRERNPPRRQGPAARTAGHAGRMGRGGELFFPALRTSPTSCSSSTSACRISCCRRSA